ncbi:MAG: hypothetical protein RL129_98 [Actinomycetota bacterium]
MHSHIQIFSNEILQKKYAKPTISAKKALLVGANSEIAQSIQNEFLDLGIELFLTYNKEIRADQFPCYQLDLTNAQSIDNLLEQFKRENLLFDVVVICSGIMEYPQEKFEELSWAEIEKVYRVNLIGPHYFMARFSQIMNPESSYVILSGGGASGPMKYFPSYSASKTGLIRLIETISLELFSDGINVNALGPGPIASPMTLNLIENETLPPQILSSIKLQIPGKFGFFNSEFTAKCVAILISNEMKAVSGKFFSAQWDDWSDLGKLAAEASSCSTNFTLRRVGCEVN